MDWMVIRFITLSIALLVLLFWLYQLADVVTMRDEEFDGRNDKLIWFLIVVWGFVFGSFAFFVWKNARQREKETEREMERFEKNYHKK